jgi:GH15 family glucan-1,4-alpha-glucosidase
VIAAGHRQRRMTHPEAPLPGGVVLSARSLARDIASHGMIGDQHSAALVADDGCIDFCCWPDFDSPSIFAAILDARQGGRFELSPASNEAASTQRYRPHSNVLVTDWRCPDGEVEVVDLMPWPGRGGLPPGSIMREVRGVRGQVRMRMQCRPRPDYARVTPAAMQTAHGVRFADNLCLAATLKLDAGHGEATAEWQTAPGESVCFLLHEGQTPAEIDPTAFARAIAATAAAWQDWVATLRLPPVWQDAAIRSALTLAMLVCARHGSFVAAPTFGLPESVGGARNWDYRASWIRDGALIANALVSLGRLDEAEQFHAWVWRCREVSHGRLGVMYALDGGPEADEAILDHLAGHDGARPVRIGNAARHQRQLDIHGELLDSIARAARIGGRQGPEAWTRIAAIADYVRKHWRETDQGIWEIRRKPREHLHSRALCYVAVDRAIELAGRHDPNAPQSAWRQSRADILADIRTRFRHPEAGHLVQAAGGRAVDAALLRLPLDGVLDSRDPFWQATMAAIDRELVHDDLVWRYRNDDGLPGEEGAFVACCFWRVAALARGGRRGEAEDAMRHLLSLGNPLGLFAEEIAPGGAMLGNFPQGLSHAAIIEAAWALAE